MHFYVLLAPLLFVKVIGASPRVKRDVSRSELENLRFALGLIQEKEQDSMLNKKLAPSVGESADEYATSDELNQLFQGTPTTDSKKRKRLPKRNWNKRNTGKRTDKKQTIGKRSQDSDSMNTRMLKKFLTTALTSNHMSGKHKRSAVRRSGPVKRGALKKKSLPTSSITITTNNDEKPLGYLILTEDKAGKLKLKIVGAGDKQVEKTDTGDSLPKRFDGISRIDGIEDAGTCPAVDQLADGCKYIRNTFMAEMDDEAVTTCDIHKVCYACADDQGIDAYDCDKIYVATTLKLCSKEEEPQRCLDEASTLLKTMRAIHLDNSGDEIRANPTLQCGRPCVSKYISSQDLSQK